MSARLFVWCVRLAVIGLVLYGIAVNLSPVIELMQAPRRALESVIP